MAIKAMSVGEPDDPRAVKLPIYDDWEAYLADYSASAPEGMKIVFQYARSFWA